MRKSRTVDPGTPYDAVIVGSGFGGSMVAQQLVDAGWRVLMIERGGWVPRGPQNWTDGAVGPLTSYYSTETPYRAVAGADREVVGSFSCVGGPSVFYGGASLRFRAEDFEPCPEIVGDSAAAWPYRYGDVEPHYSRAEQILGVAGEQGSDPTEPFHAARYPQTPGALAPTSRRIWEAAQRLGLHPSRLPLAFNHRAGNGRAPCAACSTCDGFACAIGAKNDLATAVLPALVRKGLRLEANMVAVRLVAEGRRLTGVDCVERESGRRVRFLGRHFVLSAGALASPHLLLASGLERLNPGGSTVGRYLMRHFNAAVIGLFPRRPDREAQFHKQVAIHDFYFGHPTVARPLGKLGAIQQIGTPPRELVKAHLPRLVGGLAASALPHATGLLIMAEDQPRPENRVEIDPARTDRFGLPELRITHRYTGRDIEAGRALIAKAREILHAAGALLTYAQPIRTFSHAVGTVRMGAEPSASALDAHCRFRGTENLYVVDGSAFPTSAAVNPSLTIAANALRAGEHIVALSRRRDLTAA
jgi:choline dehydrogenase-like flavoprotein